MLHWKDVVHASLAMEKKLPLAMQHALIVGRVHKAPITLNVGFASSSTRPRDTHCCHLVNLFIAP
jgi:hypothetical protein